MKFLSLRLIGIFICLALSQQVFGYDPGNCNEYLSPGADLSAEVNYQTGPYVFCLESGDYYESAIITPQAYVTIHGLYGSTDVRIHSTATRGIAVATGDDDVTLHGFTIDGGGSSMSNFGILFYQNTGGIITSVRINNLGGIGLGLNGADDFLASYLVVTNNGTMTGGQQAVWYYDSNYVELLHVTVTGNNKANGADGSINCFDGNNVTVKWAKSTRSGSAGIGARGCTNIEFAYNEILYSSEFGIDIADGSAGGDIHDNFIFGSDHTAIVFTDHDWTSCGYCGTPPDGFELWNNDMESNNRIGYWDDACDNGNDIDAIALVNDPTNITIGTGNTTDNGPVWCDATRP